MADLGGKDAKDVLVISVAPEEGVTTVALAGEVDTSTAPLVAGALTAVPDGVTVRLALTDVTYLDSSGVRALVAARRELGDRFAVTDPSHAVRRVLELSGVDDLVVEPDDGGPPRSG